MQKRSDNKANIAIAQQDMSLLQSSRLPMSSFGLLAVSFAQQILDRAQKNTAVSPMFSLDYLEENSEAAQPKVEISPVLNLDLRFLLQQMQKAEDARQQRSVRAREQEPVLQNISHTTRQNIQNIQNNYYSQTNITQQITKEITTNQTQVIDKQTKSENENKQIRSSDTAVIPQQILQSDTALPYTVKGTNPQSDALEEKRESDKSADEAVLVRQGDVYRLRPMTGAASAAYHLRRIVEKTVSLQQQRQQYLNRAETQMRFLGSEAAAAMTQAVGMPQDSSRLFHPEAGEHELVFAQETQETQKTDPALQQQRQIAEMLRMVRTEMQNLSDEAVSAQSEALVPTESTKKTSTKRKKRQNLEQKATETQTAQTNQTVQPVQHEANKNETAHRELRTIYLPKIESKADRIPIGAIKLGRAKLSDQMVAPQIEMLFSNVLQAEQSMGLTYGKSEAGVPKAPQERAEYLKKTTKTIMRREQLADAIAAVPTDILPAEELEFLVTITKHPGTSEQLLQAAERVVYRTLQLTDRTWAIPEYARPTQQEQRETLERQADLRRELFDSAEKQRALLRVQQEANTTSAAQAMKAISKVDIIYEEAAALDIQESKQQSETERRTLFEKIAQLIRGENRMDSLEGKADKRDAEIKQDVSYEVQHISVEEDNATLSEGSKVIPVTSDMAVSEAQKEIQHTAQMITVQGAARAAEEIGQNGESLESWKMEPLQMEYLGEENQGAESQQRMSTAQDKQTASAEIPMAQIVRSDAQLMQSIAYFRQLQKRQSDVFNQKVSTHQAGEIIYLMQPEAGESASAYVTRLQKESGKVIRVSEPKEQESAKEYVTRIQKETGDMIYLTQPEAGESAEAYVTRLQKESGKVIRLTEPSREKILQKNVIQKITVPSSESMLTSAVQQSVPMEYFAETSVSGDNPQQDFHTNPITAKQSEKSGAAVPQEKTSTVEQKQSRKSESINQPIEMSYVLAANPEMQSEQRETNSVQVQRQEQEQKFLKSQAKESSYYNSLPEWTKDFLENGYQGLQEKSQGNTETSWESTAIPAQNTISWQNPNAERLRSTVQPPQEIVLKQPEEKEPVEARVSNSEIRRTADQVYKIIEERLRNERRRRGM